MSSPPAFRFSPVTPKWCVQVQVPTRCRASSSLTPPPLPSLQPQLPSVEWKRFLQRYRALAAGKTDAEQLPAKHCAQNMWLLKPAFLNQGRGIEVFKDLGRLRSIMAQASGRHDWILQKYLEKPLLLWGRKFDIRIWVMVTDKFDIYQYSDGYLRTSSEAFTTDLDTKPGSHNKMVHLTNYCMQKHSRNLGKYEDGNTLSYDDLQVRGVVRVCLCVCGGCGVCLYVVCFCGVGR